MTAINVDTRQTFYYNVLAHFNTITKCVLPIKKTIKAVEIISKIQLVVSLDDVQVCYPYSSFRYHLRESCR